MKTKSNPQNHHTLPTLALLAVLAASGCSDPKNTTETPSKAPNSPLAERIVEGTPPAPALSVLEVRKTSQPGDKVTVTGRIAGSQHPFSESFAILTLVDDSLHTCDLTPGDTCPTPWDACCETAETIAAARITVQVVDENGSPLEGTLKGVKGLAELDRITVTGSISPLSTKENFLIDASTLHNQNEPNDSASTD